MRLTRLTAVAGASVALILAGGVAPSAALADAYPSWDDVQKAKASQAATQAAVTRVAGLMTRLQATAATAQHAATDAGSTLQRAQSDFAAADRKYVKLNGEASAARATAVMASTRAGRLAAQLYRSGGHNLSVALVLSAAPAGPAADGPTLLLDRLGTMTRLTESGSRLVGRAQQARNAAAAASAQAQSARDERARLQREAEAALDAAVRSSQAAQQAVATEQAHSDELNAMLAALTDETAHTVAAYQQGVRERAEEARRKQLEAQRNEEKAVPAPSSSGWVVPLVGPITSGFGPRPAPCAGCSTWHEGVDISGPLGAPIRSAYPGTVVYAGAYGGYGNFVLIDHGGAISTAYGHIVDGGIAVRGGQHVTAGQVVGHVGSTGHSSGPHLHFEVRQNGVQINPIPWMAQHGAAL